MKWISLRPYDRGCRPPNAKDEWIWVNTDKIDMMEDGDPTKSVSPPTKLTVGGTRIRVIETPKEIFRKMRERTVEVDNGTIR